MSITEEGGRAGVASYDPGRRQVLVEEEARGRMGAMATEIVFVVEEDADGGFVAHALGESIFTEADDLPSLRKAVREAVKCHFPKAKGRPKVIRLHLVRDEVISA